ncbi:MAG: homoserine O-acetyltransferase [Deltaproteobacteria bacterium]|nr:homoserine O-acetyltransferase [Deltaproteobacteria bacterium]MBM4323961.1 homoserine O-acetyltransferase [Deltaproteobacteria bacterium]
MKRRFLCSCISAIFVLVMVLPCQGLDQIVEKKNFSLKEFTLVSGKKISPVQIGYETYGTLAPTKDNVILICHFYSGNSHAAGKYSVDQKVPGYWDAIIGPGKPFDTNKYFIVSSDTLCNMNPKSPTVITTGPTSINPETGKPYGMSFPIVTIRDFVNLQYKLLESLGVKKLKAVSGASMGGLQSFEWAVAYPDFVERIIPVIATPKLHGWLVGWMRLWGDPIKLDPKWNNGDYYGKPEPVDGMTYSLMLITYSAQWADWAERSFGRKWADPQKNPFDALEHRFLVEEALFKAGAARANVADANSMLCLNKACSLFDIGQGFGSFEDAVKTIKADVLMIGADTDILFPPHQIKESVEIFQKMGKKASYFELKSPFGHLGGILNITQAVDAIKKFLEE